MPTPRAYSFVAGSVILYLFGNQTQVGWLYVVSALLMGTVIATWWLNRGAVKGFSGTRKVSDSLDGELYEGDEARIELTLRKDKGSASQIKLTEACPMADPESETHTTRLFIPSLPNGSAVLFDYNIVLDRRGLHEFPPLALESGAPFGMVRRSGKLDIPTRTLVYPEVRTLERLDLLDRKLTAEMARPRAGVGYEVLGVRTYRSGDSPRHIHWRSVAKTQQLMSKEFADEAQPGLTLVLDLFRYPYPNTASKHTPFEWAVKCAASIGDYARHKGYTVHLLADDEVLAVPQGALAWTALLQYLARVQPTGKRSLTQVMGRQPTQNFIAAILPWPDERAIEPLLDLRRQGLEVMAVVLDPVSFPDAGMSAQGLAGQLKTAGIETRRVQFGQNWAQQLQ